jgi:DNA-binding response OmpR family regulator
MPARIEVTDGKAGADRENLAYERRVLIAARNDDHRARLCRQLEAWGHQVMVADSGEEIGSTLQALPIELLLLAADLAGGTALEVCRAVAAGSVRRRPVIFLLLEKWSQDLDWIAENEVWVDDYLVEPVDPIELKLRIQARFRSSPLGESRRHPGASATEVLRRARQSGRFACGPLQVDLDGYLVYVDGREVLLSAKEMEVLVYFCQSPGFLRSRRELLASVWGYQPDVPSRTVDVCIKRLRRKLGPAGNLIETVRGLGYRFGRREA